MSCEEKSVAPLVVADAADVLEIVPHELFAQCPCLVVTDLECELPTEMLRRLRDQPADDCRAVRTTAIEGRDGIPLNLRRELRETQK